MEGKNRRTYTFHGHIMKFGRDIGMWSGETIAASVAQARNNLTYQAKQKLGLLPSASIRLEGEVRPIS